MASIHHIALLVPLVACEPVIPLTDKGGFTLDDTGFDPDGLDPDDLDPDELSPAWCLDWESGTLEDGGHSGEFIELEDGGLVLVAEEGADFSALVGEELLDFGGTHALVLRSSHAGAVDSVAFIESEPFEIVADELWWSQLSEVHGGGIALAAQLVDADSGTVLLEIDVPVETGGFIPALQDVHEPIDGFPEITWGEPTLGELVHQSADVSAFLGEEVVLRISQHTLIEHNGFFTILDDLCHG